MFSYITFTAGVLSFLFSVCVLYLYVKNRDNVAFSYASIFFLCGAVTLLSQFILEIGPDITHTAFWTRIRLVGIFGYLFAFPHFISSITDRKLSSASAIALCILTTICVTTTLFTRLVISDEVYYFGGIARAHAGSLYHLFMAVFFVLSAYYYIQLFTAPKTIRSKEINYRPVAISIGIAMVLAIADVFGIIRGEPLIRWLRHPHIFAVIIFTIGYAWTYLSQYSWIFAALDKSEAHVAELIVKSNKSFIEFVQLIAKTLEAKDHYTAGHSLRVMEYAEKIARSLDLPEPQIDLLRHACLLHDIGKIGIPDGILNKKAPLTEVERRHILNHPVVGKKILSTVTDFQNLLDIILAHHERVDGKGYPKGLTRNEIPLLARIIAVADAYDAMLSERPYRKAMTPQQALRELQRVKGTQLDEMLVDQFLSAVGT